MLFESKKKANFWQQFALQTNGTFKEGYSWNSDFVEIDYKNWKITFDNFTLRAERYRAKMTRITVPIDLKVDFKFEIYKEGFIQKIGKLLGVQDIEIGFPDFDKAFIIKSNNEFKAKTLLRNQEIRNLIVSQKETNILISNHKGIWEKKLPKNEFELSYYINGEFRDIKNLESILELFRLLLDEMVKINIISEMKIPKPIQKIM